MEKSLIRFLESEPLKIKYIFCKHEDVETRVLHRRYNLTSHEISPKGHLRLWYGEIELICLITETVEMIGNVEGEQIIYQHSIRAVNHNRPLTREEKLKEIYKFIMKKHVILKDNPPETLAIEFAFTLEEWDVMDKMAKRLNRDRDCLVYFVGKTVKEDLISIEKTREWDE